MKLRTVMTGAASPAACLAGIGCHALGATRHAVFGLRKKLGLRTTLITAAMSLALVAGGTAAGAAIASGPVDSAGVIHGCYGQANTDGTTHDVVLQNAGTTCPANMTPITWNQTGPQGQAGPAGATGPAGPPGAAGPAGPAGAPGLAGPPGSDGSTVLNGTGAPAASAGSDGDFYIDTAADVLYGPKTGGAWPATGTSLIGTPGATGPVGRQGPQGPQGPAGPPGAGSLASLDSLGGLDCNAPGLGHGTVNVAYGTGGSVSLSCAGPYTFNVKVDLIANGTAGYGCGTDLFPSYCPGQTASGTVTSTPAGLSCSVSGGGGNEANGGNSCTAAFAPGTRVTLTESTTNTFGGWTGACSGTATSCTVTMNADTAVGAMFWLP